MSIRKLIEYQIVDINGCVEHVSWQEARKLANNPPIYVWCVERVTRWWQTEDENLENEIIEIGKNHVSKTW